MRLFFFLLFISIGVHTNYAQFKDEVVVVVMGSSVAKGVGATDLHGYAYMWDSLMQQRYEQGLGPKYTFINKSVGGDTTPKVLRRWEADLRGINADYIVYGLSLGNEGIRQGGERVFMQFKDNLLKLIEKAKSKGIQPIIINNYPRQDYTEVDYEYIKQMNLFIHQLDVPSINVCGAIDDLTGKWVKSYQADFGHPNNKGHYAYYKAIPPTLLDALEEGKLSPQMMPSSGLNMALLSAEQELTFQTDDTLHAYSLAFSFIPQDSMTGGVFLQLAGSENSRKVMLNDEHQICYENSDTLICSAQHLSDNLEHHITVTHYYALGKTQIYSDQILSSIEVNEKVETRSISFSPNSYLLKDVMLYRSGLTDAEIQQLNSNQILKSSLALYCPLSPSLQLKNLAQTKCKLLINKR